MHAQTPIAVLPTGELATQPTAMQMGIPGMPAPMPMTSTTPGLPLRGATTGDVLVAGAGEPNLFAWLEQLNFLEVCTMQSVYSHACRSVESSRVRARLGGRAFCCGRVGGSPRVCRGVESSRVRARFGGRAFCCGRVDGRHGRTEPFSHGYSSLAYCRCARRPMANMGCIFASLLFLSEALQQ